MTAAERWQYIKDFVAEWRGRPFGPGDGCSAEEIATAEARLGFRLPSALRQWYELAGRRLDLTRRHHWLVLPEKLSRDNHYAPDGEFLVFWRENQGVVEWAVALDDIEQEDPPVWVIQDTGEMGVTTDSVTAFLLDMVASQVLEGGEFITLGGGEGSGAEIARKFTPLSEIGDHWLDVKFYRSRNALLMLRDDEVFIAARSKPDLEAVVADLSGEYVFVGMHHADGYDLP